MRMQSAGMVRGRVNQLRPREGSRLRATYDLFMANKGVPIDWKLPKKGDGSTQTALLDQLRDFYGLDIRRVGYKRWVLAGEWFGETYVDYISDHLKLHHRPNQSTQTGD